MDKPEFGADGSALWDEIAGNATYILRPDEERLLTLACRQLDVIAALREAFAENPDYTVLGSMKQPVINPLIQEQRQAAAGFASLMRQLGIPDDEERAKQRADKVSQEMGEKGKLSWAVRKGA